MLAHDLGHGLPAVLLFQNRNNLRFAESSFFYEAVVENALFSTANWLTI